MLDNILSAYDGDTIGIEYSVAAGPANRRITHMRSCTFDGNLNVLESLAVPSKNELPFTNQNFLLSFSLPNFYFHATTTYEVLRMLGVPLGKIDFLGQMKVGI